MRTKKNETCNGWKNRATWNVALWIGNDEPLYRMACGFMKSYKGRTPYRSFVKRYGMGDERTPDGFKFGGMKLCLAELNDMMRELVS